MIQDINENEVVRCLYIAAIVIIVIFHQDYFMTLNFSVVFLFLKGGDVTAGTAIGCPYSWRSL